MKEKEELLKITTSLEKETLQLRDQVGRLEEELTREKERCDQYEAQQKVSLQLIKALKVFSFWKPSANISEKIGSMDSSLAPFLLSKLVLSMSCGSSS